MNQIIAKLKDVAEIVMGTSPKGHFYNMEGEGLPLINGPTEFGPTHPEVTLFTKQSMKECEEGDLLFCVRGSTTGRLNWADKKYSIGRGICLMRGASTSDTKFIRYAIEHRLPALLQLAGGSTFPNLTRDTILDFSIPFPLNRNKIVSILSAYDNLVENNRKRIELLEESASELYKEWFVRLRFPGNKRTKIVAGAVEGGERICFSDIAKIDPKTKVPIDTREIKFVPMSSLSIGNMTVERNDFEIRPSASGSKFQNGDILFPRITPCLENGKTAFVNFLSEGEIACGSTEFIVFRNIKLSPEFVYCLARTHDFRGNAIKSMIGSSGRSRVQKSCFDSFYINVPPDNIFSKFQEIVIPIFKAIANLQDQNYRLKIARDILLPKLMSGEIEVKN